MSDTRTHEPIRVIQRLSLARLHGHTCWYCGAVARALPLAGRVRRVVSVRVPLIVTFGCDEGVDS
ncbi:hypothetical protein TU94_05345 [Streptomyces cyaneogriseus subsp. noncyanogenus]|uniref:Uncharacterized protein n=1 Tax=Streptomyces cyaneogriseus subsp. noncyanogenus TaxID=477245 RepID=A0A0C5FX31_9ACTN|nr:hypothetical protein [Streptomyces cyaneogriseus]AJP00980.1 hypothetical protein TU94_05345 [Streptomyces cyaneogriseus subsp. noncyanogenus]